VLVLIWNQIKKMGKMKSKIIEAYIIVIIALNISIILNILKNYEILKEFHILLLSICIILSNIAYIFFKNNIRENGVELQLKHS
jgi:hypothetical protein